MTPALQLSIRLCSTIVRSKKDCKGSRPNYEMPHSSCPASSKRSTNLRCTTPLQRINGADSKIHFQPLRPCCLHPSLPWYHSEQKLRVRPHGKGCCPSALEIRRSLVHRLRLQARFPPTSRESSGSLGSS